MRMRAVLLAGMMVVGSSAKAQEPPAEPLPAPREVPPEDVLPPPRSLPRPLLLPLPPRDPPPRFGSRSVWQLYAPGWNGRFVPRVVNSPYGPFYLSNGRPYPWYTLRPEIVRPMLLD